MKPSKEFIYDIAVVGALLILAILAFFPRSSTIAIILLVLLGLLQLIFSKIYRNAVKSSQLRITQICTDFRTSSKEWKRQTEYQRIKIDRLTASINREPFDQ